MMYCARLKRSLQKGESPNTLCRMGGVSFGVLVLSKGQNGHWQTQVVRPGLLREGTWGFMQLCRPTPLCVLLCAKGGGEKRGLTHPFFNRKKGDRWSPFLLLSRRTTRDTGVTAAVRATCSASIAVVALPHLLDPYRPRGMRHITWIVLEHRNEPIECLRWKPTLRLPNSNRPAIRCNFTGSHK